MKRLSMKRMPYARVVVLDGKLRDGKGIIGLTQSWMIVVSS